jgi:hypothetical protein
VAGADFVGTTDNQPLEFKVNDTRALRLEPNMYGAPNVIGGSPDNFVANGVNGATLAGGGAADYGPVSFTNSISADFAVLGGGRINAIQSGATDSTIGGGYFNVIQSGSTISTIAGGSGNTIGSFGSAIGGGAGNIAQTNISYCTIAGGFQNVVNGDYGTVPGGSDNTASTNCFAAGHRARANGNGNFVWADSTEADFSSSGKNQFLIRAGGGVGIGTTAPATALHVRGTGDTEISVESVQGGERWTLQSSGTNTPGKNGSFQIIDRTANASRLLIDTNGNVGIGTNPTNKLDVAGNISCSSNVYAHGVLLTSDRYAKTNFVILEQNAILKKVADLPLTQWNYLGDDEATKHIGPMAQDFHAAFGLNGGDDKHISVVDESGVALAAIQGLNQKLNEKDSEIQSLKLQNENLEKRLDSLEQAVRLFTAKN